MQIQDSLKKRVYIILIIASVILMAVFFVIFIGPFFKQKPPVTNLSDQPEPELSAPATGAKPAIEEPADTLASSSQINMLIFNDKDSSIDKDKDDLLGVAETYEYHTDPDNPDTDGDGLKDGAEVQTYRTDPLKPDTDGDGFSDGDEVKKGFNPLGEGKSDNKK